MFDVRFFDTAGNLLRQRRLRPDHRRPGRADHRGLRNPPRDRCADVGRDGLPQGPSLHFLLNNTTDKDNRIPARGFRDAIYNAIGAKVIGAVYEDGQYWSETRFSLPGGASRAEVRLFHQTTSRSTSSSSVMRT